MKSAILRLLAVLLPLFLVDPARGQVAVIPPIDLGPDYPYMIQDETVRTIPMSCYCVNGTQPENSTYAFGVNEPLEVTLGCRNFRYDQGWGEALSPNKTVYLLIRITDASGQTVVDTSKASSEWFPCASISGLTIFVQHTVALKEGHYTVRFVGMSKDKPSDGLFAAAPAAAAGNVGTNSVVMPPPTCRIDFEIVPKFYPSSEDPELTIDETIPTFDRTFPASDFALPEQTPQNAVYTLISTDGTTSGNLTASYYDGFGKLEEVVQRGFSAEKDLASRCEYDVWGNCARTWLPAVVADNGGKYVGPERGEQYVRNTYADSVCYSLAEYETSPLRRLVREQGPGASWAARSKGTTTDYLTNVRGNDTLGCLRMYLSPVGEYETGSLFVTRTVDEDGRTVFEFRDFDDKLVLSRLVDRTASGVDLFDTYYVYDELGQLVEVVPPMLAATAVAGGQLSEWGKYAYEYSYDDRGRVVARYLPGAAAEYFVYDRSDRLIFTQNGNQRSRGEWSFTISDRHGRPCLSGVCRNSFNPFDETKVVADVGCVYAGKDGPYKGYSVYGVTLQEPAVHAVYYYDHYDFFNIGLFDSSLKYSDATKKGFPKKYSSARGLETGSMIARLDPDHPDSLAYDFRAKYYDNRDRLIQEKYSYTTDQVEEDDFAYDFAGRTVSHRHEVSSYFKIEQMKPDPGGSDDLIIRPLRPRIQSELPGTTVLPSLPELPILPILPTFPDSLIQIRPMYTVTFSEQYDYTYDDWGRLRTTTHRRGSDPAVTLTDLEYDDLGRVVADRRNSNADLCSRYTYNIRSWLESQDCPLFKERLYYQDTLRNSTPAYSGNITALEWQMPQDQTPRSYAFAYDPLGRLTSANYFQEGAPNADYSTNYRYDKHGNVLQIDRNGKTSDTSFGTIDGLSMNYDGNQLASIRDLAIPVLRQPKSLDFMVETQDNQFAYDKNGNMTKDLSRGIRSIEYNSLNLPQRIVLDNSEGSATWSHIYDASGNKQTTALLTGDGTTVTTSYRGSRILENGSLKRVLIEGGYIEDGKYYFYLTDHSGSVRVVADAAGEVVQTNHYYPYGLLFAEGVEESDQPYRYNGKEFASTYGLNHYDYGARMMDPVLGRFTTPDPLSEKYYSVSPYVYCAADPVNRVDPDGRKWINKNNRVIYQNGNYTSIATAQDRNIGNELRKTPTGRMQFAKLTNGDLPIFITISQADSKDEYGKHTLYIGINSGTVVKAEIVLFEKNLSKFARQNGIRTEQSMSATLGHEIEHTTPENIQLQIESKSKGLSPLNTPADQLPEEKKPNEIKQSILNEYETLGY